MYFVHILTWALIIAIQIINELAFGSAEVRSYQISLIGFFSLTHILVFYSFYLFLGKLLNGKKLLFALLGLLVTYCIPNILAWAYFEFVLNHIVPESPKGWTVSRSFYFLSDGIVMGIVGTIGYVAKEGLARRETDLIMLKEKAEQELRALKVKVNPHFLFNTLNSIYYLTRHQRPEASEAVLLLSDNMRYVLEVSHLNKVPLLEEVEASKKLLSLLKLRVSDSFKIEFDVNINDKHKITPTVLLTLIENTLKHGDMSDEGFIHVKVVSKGEQIRINCSNRIGHSKGTSDSSLGNFGLTSLERVLQLCYPKQHSLQVNMYAQTFEVDLIIFKQ